MVFSSANFIFVFLPFVLLLYFIINKSKWRNFILIASSLLFFLWADPVDIVFLLGSTVVNWTIGSQIGHQKIKLDEAKAKRLLILGVAFNLIFLVCFKYLRFLALMLLPDAIASGFEFHSLLAPLGVSFFTFFGLSFILDIYLENTQQKPSFWNFISYMLMFPKLIQGPIAQYSQLECELEERKISIADVAEGARRFIIGLAKKVLIADYLGVASNTLFLGSFTTFGMDLAWFSLVVYSLQIYFDFSGYSDMAIGLGRILGFHFPENFNSPYTSRSLTDFWRRWHMTLTGWLRTYVFLPLEFSRRREKHFRLQSNLVIIFFLTGLWHGATPNFIVWGLYNGLVLALETGRLGKWLKLMPVFLQHIYTLCLILLGWALFRLEDTTQWAPFFTALFGGNGLTANTTLISMDVLKFVPILLVGILVCVLTPFPLFQKTNRSRLNFVSDMVLVGLLCLSFVVMISKSFQVFLYFRF